MRSVSQRTPSQPPKMTVRITNATITKAITVSGISSHSFTRQKASARPLLDAGGGLVRVGREAARVCIERPYSVDPAATARGLGVRRHVRADGSDLREARRALRRAFDGEAGLVR